MLASTSSARLIGLSAAPPRLAQPHTATRIVPRVAARRRPVAAPWRAAPVAVADCRMQDGVTQSKKVWHSEDGP